MSVRVLSLGAGVQSSALLLLLDREPERVGGRADFAVFADTGDEPAEVYRWLEVLRGAVSIPIVVASKGHLSEDQLALRTRARSPWFTLNQDGGHGMLPRNCTRDYKIRPLIRATRERLGLTPRQAARRPWVKLLGISADEAHRMKPSRDACEVVAWPLVDLGWKRADCLRYVEATGLGTPPRSACVMCPFHNDAEWRRLKTEAPEDFARAVAFDNRLREVYPPAGGVNGIMSALYLHPKRLPLAEVDFSLDTRQGDLFGNECEGVCGV